MFPVKARLIPWYASALALILLVALAACGQNAGTDGNVTEGTASPRAATAPPVVGGQPGVVVNLEATAKPEPTAAPYPTGTDARATTDLHCPRRHPSRRPRLTRLAKGLPQPRLPSLAASPRHNRPVPRPTATLRAATDLHVDGNSQT